MAATYEPPGSFTIKDSGTRREFDSGMVRDTSEGKTDFTSCLHGPMFLRWNEHMTKGRTKYPDPEPGVPNWTLAEGDEELQRARQSAFRHFIAWLSGETDEDHAAGVYFNINLAEYVKDKMAFEEQTGATAATFTEATRQAALDLERRTIYAWQGVCGAAASPAGYWTPAAGTLDLRFGRRPD